MTLIRFKYGAKTKAQIDAISTSILSVGDTVYNTDINKEEYWTGNTWLNDDCIELYNGSGVTLSPGHIVGISTAGNDYCEKIVGTGDNFVAGVVYRGAANNNWVTVAFRGRYKVLFNSDTASVTRQHIAQIHSTAGIAISAGAITVASSGGIGVIAESHNPMPGDYLVNIWINGLESF